MNKLRIYYEDYYQELRNFVYSYKNKNFPFGTKKIGTKEDYLSLYNKAKNDNYKSVDNYENFTGYQIDKNWINDLALHTQVVIKKSKICYAHGRVLYSTVSQYINKHKYEQYNILETGTSRGFSSLCMAKAMEDNNVDGKIITIDYLPHNTKFYWNCIDDLEGKKSRRELIKKWKNLSDKYISFVEGYSKIALKKIKFERINFAFLDASHTYKAIYDEFLKICDFQKFGDMIVFDDYNNSSYLGLKIAIDEICNKYNYQKEIITSATNRSYVIATKL